MEWARDLWWWGVYSQSCAWPTLPSVLPSAWGSNIPSAVQLARLPGVASIWNIHRASPHCPESPFQFSDKDNCTSWNLQALDSLWQFQNYSRQICPEILPWTHLGKMVVPVALDWSGLPRPDAGSSKSVDKPSAYFSSLVESWHKPN